MVFVVVIRDIDLSVGWMFNFSAVIAAKAMVAGVDPWIAAGIGVAFGGLLGLINGVLAVALRIPVIIITLGTLSAFRGLWLVVNESRAVVPPDKTSSFFALFDIKVFGLIPMRRDPVPRRWRSCCTCCCTGPAFGYRVQAMGSNPEAARLGGIPVDRTRILVLVLMGAIAGLTGAMFLGFREAIDPVTGGDYLLPVVAAVIIGGTPLSGGRGHHRRRRPRRADHPGHHHRDPVPRGRCQVEHVRHRRRDHPRGRRGPAGPPPARATDARRGRPRVRPGTDAPTRGGIGPGRCAETAHRMTPGHHRAHRGGERDDETTMARPAGRAGDPVRRLQRRRRIERTRSARRPRRRHRRRSHRSEAPASEAPASSAPPEAIKIGFVTHVLGNPFIQQIIDGANAAAKDLNVELQVTGPEGGDADAQLKAVQTLVASGVQGIATSVPGESMSSGLNEIVDSGIPVVQFNLLVTSVKAPYVGERSVESGRILGAEGPREARRRERDRQGRSSATASPASRSSRTGPRASRSRWPRPPRHRGPRPIRRQGRGQRELRRVGGTPGGQPGREGARRPVRPGHREPRQAPGRERRHAVRLRRL